MIKSLKKSHAAAAAVAIGIAMLPLGGTTAVADDELPEGCVLSGYIPIAGDVVADPYATLSDISLIRPEDPDDPTKESWQYDVTVNNSTNRDLYSVKLAIGHNLMTARAADNSQISIPMDYEGNATFEAVERPTGSWQPQVPGNPQAVYTTNGRSPLEFATYRELNAPTADAELNGVAVAVDWDAEIPAYDLGSIDANDSTWGRVTIQFDRPVNTGLRYGLVTTELYTAKVCAPNPTIESWTDTDGSRKITGTGSLPGDEIVVTDADGNVIGTTTVGDDLTWSITPASAFAIGKYALTVTQNDQLFELTGTSEGEIEVVGDEPTTTPTKSLKPSKVGLPKTGR